MTVKLHAKFCGELSIVSKLLGVGWGGANEVYLSGKIKKTTIKLTET
jgi:hypothetical protein